MVESNSTTSPLLAAASESSPQPQRRMAASTFLAPLKHTGNTRHAKRVRQAKANLDRFEQYDPYAPLNAVPQWCPPQSRNDRLATAPLITPPPVPGLERLRLSTAASLRGKPRRAETRAVPRRSLMCERPDSTSMGQRRLKPENLGSGVGDNREKSIRRRRRRKGNKGGTNLFDREREPTHTRDVLLSPNQAPPKRVEAVEAVAACRAAAAEQGRFQAAQWRKSDSRGGRGLRSRESIEGADQLELSEMLATLDMQRAHLTTLIDQRRLDAALKLQSQQRKRAAKARVNLRRQEYNSACDIQRVFRGRQDRKLVAEKSKALRMDAIERPISPEAASKSPNQSASADNDQDKDDEVEAYCFMVGGHMFRHPGKRKEGTPAVTVHKHTESLDPTLDDEVQMFRQIDADNDGYISADDLFKYMKNNNFPRFKGSKSDMKGIREMLQAAYLTNPSNKNPEPHDEIPARIDFTQFEHFLSVIRTGEAEAKLLADAEPEPKPKRRLQVGDGDEERLKREWLVARVKGLPTDPELDERFGRTAKGRSMI